MPLNDDLLQLMGTLHDYLRIFSGSTLSAEEERIAIPAGHPVHEAVCAVEQHYGGKLPLPIKHDWQRLLLASRSRSPWTGKVATGVDGQAELQWAISREMNIEDSALNLICWVDSVLRRGQAQDDGQGGKPKRGQPTHSEDFTSINWHGRRYRFAKGIQAQAVKALWEEWQKGGHGLTQETIGTKAGSSSNRFELSKVFRVRQASKLKPHPAWGTIIVEDGRSCYRLAAPVKKSKKKSVIRK